MYVTHFVVETEQQSEKNPAAAIQTLRVILELRLRELLSTYKSWTQPEGPKPGNVFRNKNATSSPKLTILLHRVGS